jgi:putative protease
VFNALPQSAAKYFGRMRELGIRRFRIDLLRETPDQVGLLLETYRPVVSGSDDGRETWHKLRAMNRLGVTRGTLHLV